MNIVLFNIDKVILKTNNNPDLISREEIAEATDLISTDIKIKKLKKYGERIQILFTLR